MTRVARIGSSAAMLVAACTLLVGSEAARDVETPPNCPSIESFTWENPIQSVPSGCPSVMDGVVPTAG